MRIYVASKFENKEEVRHAYKLFREAKHQITFDWTQEDASSKLGQERISYLKECADRDFCGVVSADCFVLIAHPGMKGAYVELGIALKTLIQICIVGDREIVDNIFFHMPNIRFYATIEQCVSALST